MTKYRLRNITLSVALAGLGALLVGIYVQSYRKDVQTGADTVPVLVAVRDIPAGTSGTAVASGAYLKTANVLRRTVVPGAISKGSELSGLVAGSTVYQGEQVTIRQFKTQSQGGIFSQFSGFQRAMTIPGDPNQVLAGTVSVGDRIDVLANISVNSGTDARVVVRTVLTDVEVLQAPAKADQGAGLNSGTGTGSAITLALTSTQAQRMLFAMKNSDWWLVLRPSVRPKTPSASAETLGTFLGTGFVPPSPLSTGRATATAGRGQ